MTDENVNPSTGMPALGPEPAQPDGEPGNAPEGEPGNEWAIPDAERPPRRGEGVVSYPDRYAAVPLPADAERLPAREVGTLSNPAF
jgi:hypothetical protein